MGAPELTNYSVHEQLGAGGFGEVFRARNDRIGRDVAIKVLHDRYSRDPAAVARFVAEARAANKNAHPSIVEVFDFGELPDGRAYFVMELLRGTSLRDHLEARGPLTLADALPLLDQIAGAIDAAHAANIVHRDLKPDNVFVLESGGVKLIDFGIAKLIGDADTPVTETGTVFGTPLYMSPEQCRGDRSGARSDAYSFGVLAYQLLTGTTPFAGDALALALHHLNDAPEAPSTRNPRLDERIDRVLLALLAKEPADRPLPLQRAVAQLSPEAPLPPRPRARVRRNALVAAIAAGVLAAGTGATLFAMRSSAPVEDLACPSSTTRLVGTWDPTTRARFEASFLASKRADARDAWRVLSGELDERNGRWAKMWDTACKSSDRVDDPLLYAQRITCLDNMLFETRAITGTFDGDLEGVLANRVGIGYSTDPLDDCARPGVLHAQPSGAPASKRAAIVAAEDAVNIAMGNASAAAVADQAWVAEPLITLLRVRILHAQALESPRAASDLVAYASIVVSLAARHPDPGHQQMARDAANAAIGYALLRRDDYVLPWAYATRADHEQMLGDWRAAEATLAQADTALTRAGTPRLTELSVILEHARLERARGDLTRGAEFSNRAAHLAETLQDQPAIMAPERTVGLVRIGRLAEGRQLLRATADAVVARWGPYNEYGGRQQAVLAMLSIASGELTQARAEAEQARVTYEGIGAAPLRRSWAYALLATINARLGDRPTAATQAATWAR